MTVNPFSSASTSKLQHILGLLSKNKSPKELVTEKEYPSSSEVGMYNPLTGDGIHITDDGCIEIRAGSATILLDGNNGQVTIDGKAIATNSGTFNLHTKEGGFGLGYRALNPKWLGKDIPGQELVDYISLLSRSPLTTNPAALAMTVLTLVPGAPAPVPVPFSTMVSPSPLFQPSKQTLVMANALKDMLKEAI